LLTGTRGQEELTPFIQNRTCTGTVDIENIPKREEKNYERAVS
jgi:hypothetical protein